MSFSKFLGGDIIPERLLTSLLHSQCSEKTLLSIYNLGCNLQYETEKLEYYYDFIYIVITKALNFSLWEGIIMAKILLVDDDPDLADACRLVLEKEGHIFEWSSCRREGMEKIEEDKPDLLILDIMMDEPDDGIMMARELRKNSRNFPILMFSSISKALGTEYGKDDEMVPVDEFIEKPVKPETLINKVNELLKSAEGNK
jgi:CheY-like chemotaxis protein